MKGKDTRGYFELREENRSSNPEKNPQSQIEINRYNKQPEARFQSGFRGTLNN